MPEVVLTVNGQRYAGWTSAQVTRGIEAISGSFELTVSDRWAAGASPWPIYEEDECSISVGGTTVLTGYVDKRSSSFGPQEHSLSVSGRDRAGALVDCSALLRKWELHNTPLLSLAQKLARPFGVDVSLGAGLSPPLVKKLTIDPGDTAFEVLERACRTAGLLPVSDGKAGVVLLRPGSTRCTTELVEGENLLSASADFDATGRYRRYVVLGQSSGSDEAFGTVVSAVVGSAVDANVNRAERVLVVRPEGSVTPSRAKARAEWEATVRAARANTVSATVQGWHQADGALWPVNALVHVRSPRLGVVGEMLVSQLTYSVGDGGTTTQLTLRPPNAFLPEPIVKNDGAWKELRRGV
jgi:prophage tail gpP-like protein